MRPISKLILPACGVLATAGCATRHPAVTQADWQAENPRVLIAKTVLRLKAFGGRAVANVPALVDAKIARVEAPQVAGKVVELYCVTAKHDQALANIFGPQQSVVTVTLSPVKSVHAGPGNPVTCWDPPYEPFPELERLSRERQKLQASS
jgi:hypothetical protein